MTAPGRTGKTWIKICGITSVDFAATAVEAGADAIGVVFAPKSPRCIDRAAADVIIASLPETVTPVGLFQNPARIEVSGDEGWPLPWIQLHGDEDEAFIASIEGHHIIRGFRFREDQVRRWEACPDVDVLLIDGSSGGHGESFEHARLAAMMDELTKPVVLAGGLTPDNVRAAIETVKPFGVDVSSGVESSRGAKDHGLIRAFCAAARGE